MRAATVVVMRAGGGEVDSAEEGEGLRIDWRLSRRSLMTSTWGNLESWGKTSQAGKNSGRAVEGPWGSASESQDSRS